MRLLKRLFQKKDEPINSYLEFWNWFQKNEANFRKVVKQDGNIEKEFLDKIAQKLNELKDGFYYLTGMYDKNTVELILTADGAVKNIVFVEELIKAGPVLAGWRFTALKPALKSEDVNIEMRGYKFNETNLSFYVNEFPDYPDEIDITIIHENITEKNTPEISSGIYLFLDHYLG